ncbi:unnamed protein product [Parajaminaea phylloscopi]
MEKYSRFRDSGTGIQVFLTPVPPAASAPLPLVAIAALPRYAIAIARILLLFVAILPVWALLSVAVAPLAPALHSGIHAALARLVLLVLGFSIVSPENVSLRNRGRAAATSSRAPSKPWQPAAGDIVLSNFSSWLDILVALIQFNPQLTLPVVCAPVASADTSSSSTSSSSAAAAKIARRRNAGASVVADVNKAARSGEATEAEERTVLGFKPVSLLTAIRHVGRTPLLVTDPASAGYADLATLSDAAKKAPQGRPLLVFPELVTSNNRGLLAMGASTPAIFPASWRNLVRVTGGLRMGKGQAELWVMSIKHDAPSTSALGWGGVTSATCSVAPDAKLQPVLSWLHPIPHLVTLCKDLTFARSIQVRLLDPDESPTSATYQGDAAVVAAASQHGQAQGQAAAGDALAEHVAALICNMSRLRRTALGWQDKEKFLHLYHHGQGSSAR